MKVLDEVDVPTLRKIFRFSRDSGGWQTLTVFENEDDRRPFLRLQVMVIDAGINISRDCEYLCMDLKVRDKGDRDPKMFADVSCSFRDVAEDIEDLCVYRPDKGNKKEAVMVWRWSEIAAQTYRWSDKMEYEDASTRHNWRW